MELTDRLFVPRTGRGRSFWARVHHWLGTEAAPTTARPVYVLKWVFRRDQDRVTCQLTLVDDDYFELRTHPAHPAVNGGFERFTDGRQALGRRSEVEATLIKAGWTLERYESEIV